MKRRNHKIMYGFFIDYPIEYYIGFVRILKNYI